MKERAMHNFSTRVLSSEYSPVIRGGCAHLTISAGFVADKLNAGPSFDRCNKQSLVHTMKIDNCI